ncbi:hypothetical protein [Rhodococcus sp. NBC_00297]|uniref:hypothetical protein n=1 Tax=Rhodococcus sp. NBC_00297 TaxID=2976005 RepID=UPI002E2CD7DD|nr:hypothetical protein [Rhodococcus sp. NBC_00297]
MPLIQVIQIVIVAVAALVGLPTAIAAYSERSRLETRAKTALELTDKVNAGAPGWVQLKRNSDDAVLRLAFLIEYPRTLRRRVPTLSFFLAMVTAVLAIFLLLSGGSRALVWSLIVAELSMGVVANISFRNTAAADRLIFRLFRELKAPVGLHYPRAKIFIKQWVPGVGDVFDIAAEVRDRAADQAGDAVFMTTVEACNNARLEAEDQLKSLVRRLRILQLKSFYKGWVVIPLKRLHVWYVLATFPAKREITYRRGKRRLKRKRQNATPELQAELDEKLRKLKQLARGNQSTIRAIVRTSEQSVTGDPDDKKL